MVETTEQTIQDAVNNYISTHPAVYVNGLGDPPNYILEKAGLAANEASMNYVYYLFQQRGIQTYTPPALNTMPIGPSGQLLYKTPEGNYISEAGQVFAPNSPEISTAHMDNPPIIETQTQEQQIVQAGPLENMITPTIVQTSPAIDKYNTGFLSTGKTVNPFTGENIYIKPDANALAYANTKQLAQYAYEKATPFEKGLLNFATLRIKGFEYLGESIMGGPKASEAMTINLMTESLLTKNKDEFIQKSMWESLSKTETGIVGTNLLVGEVAGAVTGGAVGAIAPKVASKVPIIAKGFGFLNTKAASILGVAGLSVGVAGESIKLGTMQREGKSTGLMLGEVMKDVTAFSALGYGFQHGYQSGTGISRIGKEYIPQSQITSEPVMRNEVIYPETSHSPNQVINDFGNSRFTQNIIGKGKYGGITTSGSVTLPQAEITVQLGSSESHGMYIGTEAIPNYLRVGSSSAISNPPGMGKTGSLLTQPKILGLETPRGERIPSNIRSKGIEAMNIWLDTSAKKGTPYISPYFEAGKKKEIEMIVSLGSKIKLTSGGFLNYEKYTIVNDIPVAIHTGTTVGVAQVGSKGTISLSNFGSGLSSTTSASQLRSSSILGSIMSGISALKGKTEAMFKTSVSTTKSVAPFSPAPSSNKQTSMSSSLIGKTVIVSPSSSGKSSPAVSLPKSPYPSGSVLGTSGFSSAKSSSSKLSNIISSPSKSSSISSISSIGSSIMSPSSSRGSSGGSSSGGGSSKGGSGSSSISSPGRSPFISSSIISSMPSLKKPPIMPPIDFKLGGAVKKKVPSKMKRLTLNTRYKPSLGGVFGFAKSVSKTPRGSFTGLEIRPVIRTKKRFRF